MKNNLKWITAAVSTVLTIVLIILIKLVDVDSIGPEGTSIGLSHINHAVNDAFGTSAFWYEVTEILGIIAILTALAFAFIGFRQLIKRKSLTKVDKEIYALAGLYVVVIGLYAFFEIVVINYRPMIMQGEEHVEASFPSSHTMLVCTIMGSAFMVMSRYVKDESICRALRTICMAATGLMIIGRLVCGVHWLTDIIGGILISSALLMIFSIVLDAFEDKDILKSA